MTDTDRHAIAAAAAIHGTIGRQLSTQEALYQCSRSVSDFSAPHDVMRPPARRNRAKTQERKPVSDYYSTTTDALPLFAAARRSDPATSHAAAKTAPVGEHQAVILEALALGPAGASGIAARCGLVPHQVNKRLTELARTGRIVETGRTVRSASGRGEREWRVK